MKKLLFPLYFLSLIVTGYAQDYAVAPNAEKQMKANNKVCNYVIYDGTGHAYMRRGDDPNEQSANKIACDKSWERCVEILDNLD